MILGVIGKLWLTSIYLMGKGVSLVGRARGKMKEWLTNPPIHTSSGYSTPTTESTGAPLSPPPESIGSRRRGC